MPSCLAPVHDSSCGAEVRTECVPPNSSGMGVSSWSHLDRFVHPRELEASHDPPSKADRLGGTRVHQPAAWGVLFRDRGESFGRRRIPQAHQVG
eukprot:3042382-Prymnesium_polylepis.1